MPDADARGAAQAARSVAGVSDAVAAFGTVTVFYDPTRIRALAPLLEDLDTAINLPRPGLAERETLHEIAVCYDEAFAPDLEQVAAAAGLTVRDVIDLHARAEYRVAAVGFMPGFGYLEGLPPALRVPRRATPRTRVPAGAVGIGGAYTGVYPAESPGGWNLIGRSPMTLFDPTRGDAAALLRAGDRVRFRPISRGEFER